MRTAKQDDVPKTFPIEGVGVVDLEVGIRLRREAMEFVKSLDGNTSCFSNLGEQAYDWGQCVWTSRKDAYSFLMRCLPKELHHEVEKWVEDHAEMIGELAFLVGKS